MSVEDKIKSQNSIDEKHAISRTLTGGAEQSDCIITDEELQNILNIFEGEDEQEKGSGSEQNAKTPPPSPLTMNAAKSPTSTLPPSNVCAPAPSACDCSPFLEDTIPIPLQHLHNTDNTRFMKAGSHVSKFDLPISFDERQYCIERRMSIRPDIELLQSYSSLPSRTLSRQGSLNNSHKILQSQSEVVRTSSNSSELNISLNKIQQQLVQQQQQHCKVQKTGSGSGSASGPLPQTPPLPPSQEQNAGKIKKGKKDGVKGQQSHSVVEKQRRDRINQLIDELRELIPPQQLPDENLNIDVTEVASSRPKHIVLNDTIVWVKLMQEQLNCLKNEVEIIRTNSGGIMEICGELQCNNMQSIEDRWFDSFQPTSHALGAMQNCHRNLGVFVEPNPKDTSTMLVKVSCRDRQGLLFDIISTFLGISVFVKSAAITTDPVTGFVNNVFEVTGNALDDVLRDYVQQSVFHSVFIRQCEGREFKRHRSGELGRNEY